jgi:hypothetical protein
MRVNFILLLHEEGMLGILSFIATTRSIKIKTAGNAELSKKRSNGRVFEQLYCSGIFWFIPKTVISDY